MYVRMSAFGRRVARVAIAAYGGFLTPTDLGGGV